MRKVHPSSVSRPSTRRRGAIFIIALGITVILTGLVLVFAQSMRTEALASANRVASHQADAVELGAEQWVLALVAQSTTDAVTITQTPAAGLQVGNGYFWILSPDTSNDQTYQFGISDETGKLNLNSATSAELQALPTTLMQQDIADAITDWRNPTNKATADGAESSYYQGLSEPYSCKNSPYESVEEVLLVKGVTPQLLYGFDLNRNGVIETEEQTAGDGQGLVLNATTTNDSRGIYNYLTVWSAQKPVVRGGSGTGLINVNTASEQVLACLPGMTQSSAQALISARASQTTTTNTAWVSSVVSPPIYTEIAPFITASSDQYSADIVAVTGDGRAFKRVKIVVDCTNSPPKIVYRKDLTFCGWPLPQELRDSLKGGQGVPEALQENQGGYTVGEQ